MITYRKLHRYKYQLMQEYRHMTPILPAVDLRTTDDWVVLKATGELVVKKHYAWDGPSGPTLDTKDFMRGSLVHDALYQLMRESLLDAATHRDAADRLLAEICVSDGMGEFRSKYVYWAVREFGAEAAKPQPVAPNETAP